MACNSDFVQYIVDQCSGAGEIAVRKMMGDYCIYCDGILFGLICDNNFYLKVTEAGKVLLKELILKPPYDGAKDYFYINDVDDREYLVSLIQATLPALPKPKAKKNPMK
ncbi:MAG: TfoX/Sxy family protein [Candidatus Cryptobacteroides sp.]